ncbi:MAG: Crp/Fnr family transcriptional regulator [Halieaceae bacterium]|jgi:CRP-like cAMP-binding protein|nr:Crp/Fnr family transcriptional regulator [Halieaceae bacterium]
MPANYHGANQLNDRFGQLRMGRERSIETVDEARELLRRRGWLTHLPEDLREQVLARCRLLPPYERGQQLLRFGDPASGIYGIVSGSFSIRLSPSEHGQQVAHLYTAGAWVGELAYCLDRPRVTSLTATRQSRTVFLRRTDLVALTAREPTLWRWLALCLAQNTQIALCAIDDMTLRPPRHRLIATLLRLAGLRPEPNGEGATELDLTQAELASVTNMSRTAVGEQLRRLEHEGLLLCRYGRITLADPAALHRLLG